MGIISHFVFEIVKIAILAFIYSGIIFLFPLIFKKPAKSKTRFNWRRFLLVYKIIAALLFVFPFTYYGNHGFGDEEVIPLGHGEKIRAGDDNTYFESDDNKSGRININTYQVKDDILCASTNSGLFVYRLGTKQIDKFADEQAYNTFALARNLPPSKQFLDFETQYNNYWGGWRFWMLP
jgi:energy-coupling factor transporter transmembrane protein EcfT